MTSQDIPNGERRWDDPPPEESVLLSAQEDSSSVIILAGRSIRPADRVPSDRVIQLLAFTLVGGYVIALIPRLHSDSWSNLNLAAEGTSELQVWATHNGMRVMFSGSYDVLASGSFACAPDNTVAAAYFRHEFGSNNRGARPARTPRFYTLNLTSRNRRLKRADLSIQAPLAFTSDGKHIACISALEPSRIQIYDFIGHGVALQFRCQLPQHISDVTHLAFMPDGASLINLSRDGPGRRISLCTGQTMDKFEIETRHAPRLLQLSPDGSLGASVWGWEGVLWRPSIQQTLVYNINAARQTEGWPLCISPNCEYLCCRTEGGFDIMDLETGKFRGVLRGISSIQTGYVSAAAFNQRGDAMVVAISTGQINTYSLVKAS